MSKPSNPVSQDARGPAEHSEPAASSPTLQGEGDYAAARRYRADVEGFVKGHDVEAEARAAAPRDAAEARELADAERQGKARSRDDHSAASDVDAAHLGRNRS